MAELVATGRAVTATAGFATIGVGVFGVLSVFAAAGCGFGGDSYAPAEDGGDDPRRMRPKWRSFSLEEVVCIRKVKNKQKLVIPGRNFLPVHRAPAVGNFVLAHVVGQIHLAHLLLKPEKKLSILLINIDKKKLTIL